MASLVNFPPEKSTNENLCLPENYLSTRAPTFVPTTAQDREEAISPYYDFAQHLLAFSGLKTVIDIGMFNGRLLLRRFQPSQISIVGPRGTHRRVGRQLAEGQVREHDFRQPLTLPTGILSQSVVLCADLLHRLSDPHVLLDSLKEISKVCPYVILGTPDRARIDGPFQKGPPSLPESIRHWTLQEAAELLEKRDIDAPFRGYVGPSAASHLRSQLFFLMGSHCLTSPAPAKKVTAIVSCFNDADIITHTYRHLKDQGICVAFVDNWSSDETWLKIQRWRAEEPLHCVHAERFPPEGPSEHYEWHRILERKSLLAQELQSDWFIHYDSDELRESPIPKMKMVDAISRIDALGYNAIDHTVLDFRPTDESFDSNRDPKKHFNYFEFGSRVDHFMQIKGWKRQQTAVNLHALGGHVAFFPDRRCYPLKFLLRHYSVRSPAHAKLKFFQHRLPRIEREMNALQWHTHLAKQVKESEKRNFLWNFRDLLPFSRDLFDHEYVLQRLTGVGIYEKERMSALDVYKRTGVIL